MNFMVSLEDVVCDAVAIRYNHQEFNVKPKEIKPGAPGKDIGIRVYTDILIMYIVHRIVVIIVCFSLNAASSLYYV